MSGATPQTAVNLLITEFERRRWRNVDQAALKIVRALEATQGAASYDALARIPSAAFLARNRATRADIRAACERALSGVHLARPRPPLIPIETIDSFAKASDVPPQAVAEIAARKLPLSEDTVKDYISRIIGEPYRETDWGGELSDILTSRVVLEGERATAAFLLKGKSFRQKLRPADLGKNGDQIRRLTLQHADLYVVQHVGQFDEAVRDQLRDAILARRAEGSETATGSIWDGSDCARLFLAHGLIDPHTGEPLS